MPDQERLRNGADEIEESSLQFDILPLTGIPAADQFLHELNKLAENVCCVFEVIKCELHGWPYSADRWQRFANAVSNLSIQRSLGDDYFCFAEVVERLLIGIASRLTPDTAEPVRFAFGWNGEVLLDLASSLEGADDLNCQEPSLGNASRLLSRIPTRADDLDSQEPARVSRWGAPRLSLETHTAHEAALLAIPNILEGVALFNFPGVVDVTEDAAAARMFKLSYESRHDAENPLRFGAKCIEQSRPFITKRLKLLDWDCDAADRLLWQMHVEYQMIDCFLRMQSPDVVTRLLRSRRDAIEEPIAGVRTATPLANSEYAPDDDEREAILWLFCKLVFSIHDKRSSTAIFTALEQENRLGACKETFETKLTRLKKEAGFLDSLRGRGSGYWLTAKGREVAQRLNDGSIW